MKTTYIALPYIGSMTIARFAGGKFMRPLWIRKETGEVEINCGARLVIYLLSHGAEQRWQAQQRAAFVAKFGED